MGVRARFEGVVRVLSGACVALAGGTAAQAQVGAPINLDNDFVKPQVSVFARSGRDFSGVVWGANDRGRGGAARTKESQAELLNQRFAPGLIGLLQPKAAAIYQRYRTASGRFNPQNTNDEPLVPDSACEPFVIPGDPVGIGVGMRFLIADDIILIVQGQNNSTRVVYMNQTHPDVLSPRWLGHSIGRWEGDSLVIDTSGFNALSTIGSGGVYHSTALRTVERFTLIDDGERLEAEFTFEDPAVLKAPYTFKRVLAPQANQQIAPEERICQEASNRPVPISTRAQEPLG